MSTIRQLFLYIFHLAAIPFILKLCFLVYNKICSGGQTLFHHIRAISYYITKNAQQSFKKTARRSVCINLLYTIFCDINTDILYGMKVLVICTIPPSTTVTVVLFGLKP